MINLQNYEEYFLLYADGELTSDEMLEVAAFIEKYPHLHSELDLLLETVFQPEEVSFDKSLLLKDDKAFIRDDNFEETFILYHDKELNREQMAETEAYVRSHPGVKENFELLGMVKLQPDLKIKFPDKARLYRRSTAAVRLLFLRYAAAAIVLGACLFIGYHILIDTREIRMVAGAIDSPGSPGVNSGKTIVLPGVEEFPEQRVPAEKADEKPEEAEPRKAPQQVMVAGVEKVPSAYKNEIKNKQMPLENAEVAALPEIARIEVPPVDQENRFEVLAGREVEKQQTITYAAYGEEDHFDSETFVFGVPVEDIKRTKLGALLKQVGRLVERSEPVRHLRNLDEKLVTFSH